MASVEEIDRRVEQPIAEIALGLGQEVESARQQAQQPRLGPDRRIDRIAHDVTIGAGQRIDGRRKVADEACRDSGAFLQA